MKTTHFPAAILALAFIISGGPAGGAELKPKAGPKPFEYGEAPGDLPNYTPNAQWGTQGDPIRRMQKPLAPAQSGERLVAPPDFTGSLFAAEPDVVKAIWLNWDERGRLWVASTVDYPNNMQPEGQGNDRLVICEDSDGEGKADKFKTFADRLSVPTGFVFAKGGVIVVHSGKTEFLADTDGDDRADVRRELFRGWGTQDTHAGPSNLRYGFDNWIWGVVGYSGFRGTVGGKELRFGQGIFRFKPDGSALEFVRSSNNNTWGLGFTEDNIVIGSTANGNASMHMPIANRFYESVNGLAAAVLGTIADSQTFYPITDRVRQVDYHGKFTAAAGSAIYTARSFPKEYWNRAQFVTEPTGHLVAQFNLERRGSDFVAVSARNFAASDDEWTSPVCAEVGPDGAVWVSDWYNYIIQHNPTPRGFRNGKGNAYETPLRDTVHGRIYRISHAKASAPELSTLAKTSPKQLVAALKSNNLFWRMTAQRLLVERGNGDVQPELIQLVRDTAVDEIGLNPAAIHALWTLNGLGAWSDAGAVAAATGALKHPSPGVRRAAVMVAPRAGIAAAVLLSANVLADSDAQVRLAALLALSEMPPSVEAAGAILAMLQNPANAGDRWIPDGASIAGARNDTAFLREALGTRETGALKGESARVLQAVTRHYAQRSPGETLVGTLERLKGARPEIAAPILDGLVAGWPREKAPALTDVDRRKLGEVMEAIDEPLRDRLLALSLRWDQPALFGDRAATIIQSLRAQTMDGSAPEERRVAAAGRLMGIDSGSENARFLLGQVSVVTPPGLVTGWLNAVAESRDAETAQAVISIWPQFTPVTRRNAVQALSRRAEWAQKMLDSVESGVISRGDLGVDQWAQLKSNPNRAVAGRATRLMQAGNAVSADREEIVKKLLPLAQEKGDAARGKEVYAIACAVCHTLNGQGGKVGPDLSGIGAKDRREILTDILDPNRSVEANYRLWNVTTRSGETFSGRLETETQTTIGILDTTGQAHAVQRKDIASLAGLPTSIMPTGFESLPPDDLKALLEYICAPH